MCHYVVSDPTCDDSVWCVRIIWKNRALGHSMKKKKTLYIFVQTLLYPFAARRPVYYVSSCIRIRSCPVPGEPTRAEIRLVFTEIICLINSFTIIIKESGSYIIVKNYILHKLLCQIYKRMKSEIFGLLNNIILL